MSYYAIMPAPVRYSRTLTPTDKLVYSELAARAQGNLAMGSVLYKIAADLLSITEEEFLESMSRLALREFIVSSCEHMNGLILYRISPI